MTDAFYFAVHFNSLLMSAVSGEDMQDRTDRAILTPWLKFLWESYRQCLDLLRNNQSVEKLYHEVAQNGTSILLLFVLFGKTLMPDS